MIYNLVRSAALAWLLHAGIGFVFDSGSEASSDASTFVAAVPAAACAMPAVDAMRAVESDGMPDSASTGTRTSLTASPLSLLPLATHDAFDLRIIPNAARVLRSIVPPLAGAQP